MKIFCWGKEELVEIETCFDCKDRNRCVKFKKAYQKHPQKISTLEEKWDKTPPTIEIIIRRKNMPKGTSKKTGKSSGRTRKEQKYIYFYDKKGQEVYETGTKEDILKLYQSGSSVKKIFKLGDEMEIVVKLEKKKF